MTVARGAISGFHSLAATGTTVKQIGKKSEVRRVGYNAMILEGSFSLLAPLLMASALPALLMTITTYATLILWNLELGT
jgi:carbon starvation protein